MTPGPYRTWVFIDAQNVYKDAREGFHDPARDPSSYGQFDPRLLAELLTRLGGADRVLHDVRVFTGMPSASKQPKAYAAHMKQRSAWIGTGVKVFPRPLRYPEKWPDEPAQEKGVDVALAVDLLYFGLLKKSYDVAVVASTDTDLVPALEVVCEHRRAWGSPKVEVVTWAPNRKQIRVVGTNIWCHRLTRDQYESVRDRTSYVT